MKRTNLHSYNNQPKEDVSFVIFSTTQADEVYFMIYSVNILHWFFILFKIHYLFLQYSKIFLTCLYL